MSRTRDGVDTFSAYIEEETGRGWRKVRRQLNGYDFRVYDSKTEDYIMAFKACGAEIALNDMSDRLEISWDGRPYHPIADVDENVLFGRLLDFDMRNEGYMRKSLHTFSAINRYHPVQQYLESLEWDGQDHLAAFLNHLEMTSDGAATFWRKWLIGSVAKTLDQQQNFMLVLLGAQGKGKSRLARWLCPLPALFHEGPINPANKDDLILLLNNWFWEVAELDSTTRKADRAALKHFVTMKRVRVRVPYGRYDIDKPAAASMIGTINPDGAGFLSDPTGNRRFAVVHLDDIDWRYETNVNRDQLWAQVYHEYTAGGSWELSSAEQEIQADINRAHMIQSPLEELLLEHYEIDPSQEWYMGTMAILDQLETLGLRGDQYRNKMELTTILEKYGLGKSRRRTAGGNPMHGYQGIRFRDKTLQL